MNLEKITHLLNGIFSDKSFFQKRIIIRAKRIFLNENQNKNQIFNVNVSF